MAEKKAPLEKGVTPAGIAQYPYLNTPDNYQGTLNYKVSLVIDGDEAADLVTKLTAAADAHFEATKDELKEKLNSAKTGADKAKAKKALEEIKVHYPFKDAVDDEGEPNGNYVFSFKAKAEYKDAKTGAIKKIVVPLFDAAKKPTTAVIRGGSTLKVAYVIAPFAMKDTAGVSLRLTGVQIKELVSGSYGSADSLGFDEEEGFTDDGSSESNASSDVPQEDEEF